MPATTRKHERLCKALRKTAKWGGAAGTFVLLVVWIGSGWVSLHYKGTTAVYQEVDFGRWTVFVPSYDYQNQKPDWGWSTQSFALAWGFRLWWTDVMTSWVLPLWLPALLSLLATAAAWSADAKYLRRVREGACPGCGYDRAGLAAGSLCPECGKQPEAR